MAKNGEVVDIKISCPICRGSNITGSVTGEGNTSCKCLDCDSEWIITKPKAIDAVVTKNNDKLAKNIAKGIRLGWALRRIR